MNKEDVIIELLHSFKEETLRRFEQIDKRFEQIEQQIIDLKTEQRRMSDRLEKIWEAREQVKITFGWQWAAASFFIATLSAGIVGIFA